MKIDFCIPAYNEETIIEEASQKVRDVLDTIPGAECRLVIADNRSTDETAVRAKRVSRVEVLEVPFRGKGAAIVAAAQSSDADFFGFIDADLSADPADIPTLLRILFSDGADIVIGSRLMDTRTVSRGFFRTLSSRALNAIRRSFLGITALDTQCGLKTMNVRGRETLAECSEKGWFFDMEFLARAEMKGLIIREVPVHWNEYRFPNRESKLSLWRDAPAALFAMARIRRRLAKDRHLLGSGIP